MVSECVNADVWIIMFDILGDGIDETNEGGGGTSFSFIKSFARFALAPVRRIILRNTDNGGFGMLLYPFPHLLSGHLDHVRIREAPLDVARGSFAVDKRKIFGMRPVK